MQADREDRFASDANQSRHSTQTMITAIAVLILAGGAYLLMPSDDADEPAAELPAVESEPALPVPTPAEAPAVRAPQPTPEPEILAAPDIPQAADPNATPAFRPVIEEEAPPAQPTPEEIDAQLREAIVAADLVPGQAIASAYQAPYLLDRGVSSLDQLARGLVPQRTLNLARPKGRFAVTQAGLDYAMDSAGYGRYDTVVAAITALDTDAIAGLFQRLRPQLRDAYALLGYPVDAMDNTVIAALDNIIAAPVLAQPPALTSKGAMWAYRDPALESSSDLHKQLLRAGPENTRALQRWASELRSALLTP